MRNYSWQDILDRLKQAQNEFKLNIRKQELTELGGCGLLNKSSIFIIAVIVDVYHRMLRFKNYLVAMINKDIIPVKQWLPFYGEKYGRL